MLRQLQSAARFDASGYVQLLHASGPMGWVQREFARALEDFPDTFQCDADAVRLVSTARLDAIARALAERGWIAGWRNERYAVHAGAGGDTVCELERAAFRRFGLLASAAHLNGWMREGSGWKLWIARRSATKPIDPGQLDNLVGGGIAAGSTPWETLIRECAEEAGLPAGLARRALAAGTMRVTRGVSNGLHDEIIHIYDLELPAQFVPQNRDGEVAAFMLLAPSEAAERLERSEFTVDAGAVTIDFLWRRGEIRDPAVGVALDALRAVDGRPDPRAWTRPR